MLQFRCTKPSTDGSVLRQFCLCSFQLGFQVCNGLSLSCQEAFVFQKVISHPVEGFLGKIERLRFVGIRKCHQMKDQTTISGTDVRRNRGCAEGSPTDTRGRRSVQKTGNQTSPCHGGVGHDFIQYAGLDGQDCRQCRVQDTLRITGHSVHIDSVTAMTFQPDVDIGFSLLPSLRYQMVQSCEDRCFWLPARFPDDRGLWYAVRFVPHTANSRTNHL